MKPTKCLKRGVWHKPGLQHSPDGHENSSRHDGKQ